MPEGRRSEQQYQAGIMPCIACTAFTTLRSDHHRNARTPHHCAEHSTLKTPLDTQSPQHAQISVGQDGIRPRHKCPALIVVNFMLHIISHAAMAKFGIRSLCQKDVAQSNNIKLGSCHASHARPSQHFVQTITATPEHHITVQTTQHATRHAIAAACSDLSGSGWNQAKTHMPGSHCGKFHFAHHLTCCNG